MAGLDPVNPGMSGGLRSVLVLSGLATAMCLEGWTAAGLMVRDARRCAPHYEESGFATLTQVDARVPSP